MGGDEGVIQGLLLQQQVAQAVQQHQIGSRSDGQVQIGCVSGSGSPRIRDHQSQSFGLLALALNESLKQHRVAVGRVGANQQHQIRQIEIVVATGGASEPRLRA